jgi:hypothetical protein
VSGSLVVLARQSPLNGGVTVPGAQLFVYDAGTTTKRTIYTTSALSVQHDNPVDADANGRFPAVWVDPDGAAYKIVLAPQGDSDPPTSPFWTEDNIPVVGAALLEGSFPVALTGFGTPPTGTVNYRVVTSADGTGKLCTLWTESSISGTSNATSMTMTGLPAVCTPGIPVQVTCGVQDDNSSYIGQANIAASGTAIVFAVDSPLSGAGFTNPGTKGIFAGWSITFPL